MNLSEVYRSWHSIFFYSHDFLYPSWIITLNLVNLFAYLSPHSQTIHWQIVPPFFNHPLEQFSPLGLIHVTCGILINTDVVPHLDQPLWADPSSALRTKNLDRGLDQHLRGTLHILRTEPYFHKPQVGGKAPKPAYLHCYTFWCNWSLNTRNTAPGAESKQPFTARLTHHRANSIICK